MKKPNQELWLMDCGELTIQPNVTNDKQLLERQFSCFLATIPSIVVCSAHETIIYTTQLTDFSLSLFSLSHSINLFIYEINI